MTYKLSHVLRRIYAEAPLVALDLVMIMKKEGEKVRATERAAEICSCLKSARLMSRIAKLPLGVYAWLGLI